MPTLIDIAQSAFTKGRNISDNILMAQELFRGYSRENGVAKCAIKIDLHKAFDSLSWEFIISVLHRMNFPIRFVGWIKDCITSPRYSIKINGVLEGFFPGAEGLRQGDPMSPYLFALAINVLSCLLANKPEDFKLHPKCKELGLTHLLYADDVLLFSGGTQESITHLMTCLNSFASFSGLKPNADKSHVYFSNCSSSVVSWFDSRFGIPHGVIPVKFLGVPLISTKLSVNDCMPLIEKLTSRIYNWTNILLSLVGRVQLIKAVLFAIQSYWTNHFLLPGVVHAKIQSIMTRFLWRGALDKKGGAKVSWANLCTPKNEGEIGLKNPKDWNRAQLLHSLLLLAASMLG